RVQIVWPHCREDAVLLRSAHPFAILAFPFRRTLHGGNLAIGPDSNMIFAANINGVLNGSLAGSRRSCVGIRRSAHSDWPNEGALRLRVQAEFPFLARAKPQDS